MGLSKIKKKLFPEQKVFYKKPGIIMAAVLAIGVIGSAANAIEQSSSPAGHNGYLMVGTTAEPTISISPVKTNNSPTATARVTPIPHTPVIIITPSPTPSLLPTVSPVPTEIQAPPTQPPQRQIVLNSLTSPIGRNEKAVLAITGVPNTQYEITVYYASGPSKASGLEPKISDSDGYVSWTWKIGGRTGFGTYRIVVSGGGQTYETNIKIQ